MRRLFVWVAWMLPVVLQCAAAPGRERPAMSGQQPDASSRQLPWERNSPSEVLAASHIFVVTMLAAVPSPWVAGGGLERRDLQMTWRLDAILKGVLGAAVGQEFHVTVAQVRERGRVVSDFHGFWSHVQPAVGTSYLALSSGVSEDPSSLMQEPAIRVLVPSAQQSDVTFAAAAEARLAPLPGSPPASEAALLDLLKDTAAHRQTLGDLGATYVVARANRGDLRWGPLTAAILDTVMAPDTSPTLRSVLARELSNAALDQDASPGQRAEIARALFGLADIAAAADLFERLLSAELYSLIFTTDEPALKAQDVIGDRAERQRLAAMLKEFDDDRVDEIAAWLRGA